MKLPLTLEESATLLLYNRLKPYLAEDSGAIVDIITEVITDYGRCVEEETADRGKHAI